MSLLNQLNQYLTAILTMVVLATTIVLYLSSFRVRFWWMNFLYSLPVIGKLARLSQDNTRASRDQSWTNGERTLCHDYKQFLHLTTESEFRKRLVYLSKAHDLGRTPLPGWLILLLATLVIAEGLGFSYLLGSWMAMEGSENTRQLLMVAIVFVLCVILLFITHSAGHQLYRTGLIRRCEKEWRDDGQPGSFKSGNVMLNDGQSKDDQQPEYTQCVNRVGTEGNYFWIISAAILIALIAVGSTWMRVKHLEGELTQATTQTVNPFLSSGGTALPGDVLKPQQEAENKGTQDAGKATSSEGLAAFLMLAIIFVATQMVAISAGYRWGFVGKESHQAYEGTRGFATYDDYLRYFEPIVQIARAKLQALQQRLMERPANKNLRLEHTFEDYLAENQRLTSGQPQATLNATVQMQATASVESPEASIEELLGQYDAISPGDKERRMQFIKSIQPETVKERFKQILRDKKEADSKRRAEREDQELEDLV